MAAFGIIVGLFGAGVGIFVGLVAGLVGMVLGLLGGALGLLPHLFPVVLIAIGIIWLVKRSSSRSGGSKGGAWGARSAPQSLQPAVRDR